MAVLLSDKVKFRAKNIRGSKEHYIMIRVNTPRGRNNPKCVGAKKAELTELKGEIDKSTIIIGQNTSIFPFQQLIELLDIESIMSKI